MRPKDAAAADDPHAEAAAIAQRAVPPWELGAPHWAPGAPELIGPPRPPKPPSPRYDGPRGALLMLMRGNIGCERTELSPDPVEEERLDAEARRKRLAKLKEATRKAEKLRESMRAVVRDDAFDDWVRRCTIVAEHPREWTQAAVLYASYLRWAGEYGWNRQDYRVSKRELATDTRFGLMLRDIGILKKRRAGGQFYPLRLKQGA